MVDLDWLLDRFPVLLVVPTSIYHGQSDARYSGVRPSQLTIKQVTMPITYGINHGKLFVLFYHDHVRVAISTSNLLRVDYERKSQVGERVQRTS